MREWVVYGLGGGEHDICMEREGKKDVNVHLGWKPPI